MSERERERKQQLALAFSLQAHSIRKNGHFEGILHQRDEHNFEQAPGVGEGQGKSSMLQSTGSQRVGHR